MQDWKIGKLYHDTQPDTTPNNPIDVMIALSLLRNLHHKGQLSTFELSFTTEHYKNPTVIEHGREMVSSLTNYLSLSLSFSLWVSNLT